MAVKVQTTGLLSPLSLESGRSAGTWSRNRSRIAECVRLLGRLRPLPHPFPRFGQQALFACFALSRFVPPRVGFRPPARNSCEPRPTVGVDFSSALSHKAHALSSSRRISCVGVAGVMSSHCDRRAADLFEPPDSCSARTQLFRRRTDDRHSFRRQRSGRRAACALAPRHAFSRHGLGRGGRGRADSVAVHRPDEPGTPRRSRRRARSTST